MLGTSTAVDMAIGRALDPDDMPWFLQMSFRAGRIRLRGVRHCDVIRCFSKASIADVQQKPNGMWRDFKVAKALIRKTPGAVQWLPRELRNNERIMRTAVKRKGTLIQWASDRLRSNLKMAKLSVANGEGRECLRYLSPEMRMNRAVVLEAVSADGSAIESVEEEFLDHEETVFKASLTFPALPLASERLQGDDAFVCKVATFCLDTLVGPNLMPFLEETERLNAIAKEVEDDLVICRIRLLSGRAVLTSFTLGMYHDIVDWRRDCLGLHKLFPRGMPRSGTVMCNGTSRLLAAWSLASSAWWDLGVQRHELNEVQLVITPK